MESIRQSVGRGCRAEKAWSAECHEGAGKERGIEVYFDTKEFNKSESRVHASNQSTSRKGTDERYKSRGDFVLPKICC